ncbi:MAG TPA: hypothetical protein DEB40_04455 [Elusimicrobia bacterium]|nr:hypothetical protein [Elusimicrobiota bacterium]HBT60975.1 hypothetical protein [Elusimicrobiota bacterium]
MTGSLRVLMVEDSENDALLLKRQLERAGYAVTSERVCNAAAVKAALARQDWDIVISDYAMPDFSGLDALRLIRRKDIDLPFIIVSGAIGEDVAVAAMKAGAHDYVMKSNLARLAPAVRRELREAVVRREAKRAEESVRQALMVRTNFISMMTHELLTPLSVIKGGLAMLLESGAKTLGKKEHEMLLMTIKNSDRLEKLVRAILDFQDVAEHKTRFNIGEYDLNEVVKEVCVEMTQAAQAKGLTLVVQLADFLPRIRFDKERIARVLSNLINNAVSFTEKGGITVITKQGVDCVQVSVKDSGCGIKHEDMRRLFHGFEQLDVGLTRKAGGVGLGLAIAKEFVDRHGGVIWAESEFGRGSSFCFTLPMSKCVVV